MIVYIINLIFVTIFAIFSSKKIKTNWISVILVSLPLICVSGFRYGVGTDFYTYYNSFKIISQYKLDFLFSST